MLRNAGSRVKLLIARDIPKDRMCSPVIQQSSVDDKVCMWKNIFLSLIKLKIYMGQTKTDLKIENNKIIFIHSIILEFCGGGHTGSRPYLSNVEIAKMKQTFRSN